MEKGDSHISIYGRFKRFLVKAWRILRYAKPYWHMVLLLFIITALLSILSLAGPYLVKILLDDILPYKNVGLLLQLMSIFILIFVVKTLVGIWHSYQTTRLVETMVLDVKTELFAHVEDLDLSFYHSKSVGDILYRLDEDVYSIDSFINLIVDMLLLNLLTAIFILIICFNLNWKVTVMSLGFFPFFVIAQKYFGDKIRKQKQRIILRLTDMLSFLEENITGIKAIKSFALETKKLGEYTDKTKKLIRLNLRMDLLDSFSEAVVGIITFIPLIVILWYGSYQVILGVLTIGSLIAIYTYIGKLFDPIASLGSMNIALQTTLVSVNRVFQFMDTKTKIKEKPNAVELKNPRGHIAFKAVSFSYPHAEPVLERINFEIKPGQMFGLVGPSGSGKTTVGNLMFRFFDPTSGSITIDGHDMRDLKIKSIRDAIGIVSQESILFNTTLKENIRFGKTNASDAEVIRAAKLAHIHEFIMKQPKRYESKVGEHGVKLSGGEKQRISIARVFLKNPKILILDEATSSLDSESEYLIQQALQRVTEGRTTLVIAHRLSTIRNADIIIVLKDKNIKEQGSFAKLMKKKGLFYYFYKTQFAKSAIKRHQSNQLEAEETENADNQEQEK
ncbi:MAG: ABC transporter ATP-binding protein [Candidatus Woesearchaeota archaeon]|nr:ABC transporter ATP-binding protein [Candidatus Woesearchaeota archaeon]